MNKNYLKWGLFSLLSFLRNLLRFPPVYGSTSFQLADLDHDG